MSNDETISTVGGYFDKPILNLLRRKYERMTKLLEKTCLWQSDALFKLMPYKMELPRNSSARAQVVNELGETCERRALALFKALSWLLPGPLLALYVTATADGTLLILMIARFFVDADMPWYKTKDDCEPLPSPKPNDSGPGCAVSRAVSTDRPLIKNPTRTRKSRLSANGLAVFGVLIHVFQFFHFVNRTILISSPYGFCSNIFVFLITGFTSYSFWCTVVLCIVKNFAISMLYLTLQPSLNDTEIEYFYAYWCSCAIVLTVLTPVHLETIGRIIAEGQATTYKKHMNDLLRASFDACVWVDDKLRVMEAEPKLDLMFMRSMKRQSLLDYVKHPESDRFEQNVTTSIENRSTSLHHVTFSSDDPNTLFDVDLYITSKLSYWSRDGQHHLVGIRLRNNSTPELPSVRCASTAPPSPDPIPSPSTPPPGKPTTDSWECPECHCVNFGATSDDEKFCILCGCKYGQIEFGCGIIHEHDSEYSDEAALYYPHSEFSWGQPR